MFHYEYLIQGDKVAKKNISYMDWLENHTNRVISQRSCTLRDLFGLEVIFQRPS